MSKKVRAAVIGLGWAGTEHAKGYRDCPDAELVALCDLDKDRLADRADELEVTKTYRDYRKMLRSGDVDVVSVCTPNQSHCPLTVAALRAGKHVLCEKPPARTVAEARKMAAEAKKARRTLMYAMVLRFDPATRFLKGLIEQGEFGDIYYGRAAYLRRRGIPIGAGGWFLDKERSGGGALIDIGVHVLDLIWYLMGTPRPVAVSGAAFTQFRHAVPEKIKFNVDDASFGLVKFDSGAVLAVEASWAINLPANQTSVIVGTQAGAQVRPEPILYHEKNGVLTDTHIAQTGMPEGYGDQPSNPFVAEVSHFVRVVQGREKLLATAQHGVHLMQMLEAIYKSSNTGKEVRLKK